MITTSTTIYQFRLMLLGIQPKIWRRIQIGHGDSVGQASFSPVTAAVKIAPLKVLGYAVVRV